MALLTMKRRVALLLDSIRDDHQAGIVHGAAHASLHANVQLTCIAGGVLGDSTRPPFDRNFLFDLVEPQAYDGTLALVGALSNHLGVPHVTGWLKRFAARPLVSVGVELPDVPSITFAGAKGMGELIKHLLEVHGHHRIAFVRGPSANPEAEERYAAYLGALEAAQVVPDPRLVLAGNWSRDSGALAIRELFDSRGVAVESVSAIAAANDFMALGALDELRQRGVSVPNDVAVVGFDDVEALRAAVPPLTTVRQPSQALGREALRRLIGLTNKQEEALLTTLPATLVLRRSCGCSKVERGQRIRQPVDEARSFELAIVERRDLICAELSRAAQGALFGAGSGWEQLLLNALLRDLASADGTSFLTTLDRMLLGLQNAGADLSLCPQVIGTLGRAVQDCAARDSQLLARLDEVLDGARELVAEWLVRNEVRSRSEMFEQLREFSRMSAFLMSAPSRRAIQASVEERFRRLDIPALSLGLFSQPGQVSSECVCLAAYNRNRRLEVPDTFRTSDFGPAEVFENDTQARLVLPLLFDGVPLGILTVVLSDVAPAVYEQLREALSIGLHGMHLASAKP
jgi:hypothetical protein